MTQRVCYQCQKRIRTNSRSAIYLGFIRACPKGDYEAWLCSKKCVKEYDGE
jgi:hypothetical protein